MGIGPELPPHLRKTVAQDDSDSDQDSVGPSIGPSIGPSRPEPEEEPESADVYAPSLPPELLEARKLAREKAQGDGSSSKRVLGPALPPSASASASYNHSDSESDDDGMVGPVLPSSADKDLLSKQSKIREFEERAERMRKKLAGEDEVLTAKAVEPSREEWMMVPPESRLLGDDPLKVTARKFLKREHKPQDSSLWTETPADREKRLKGQPKDDDYNEGSSSRSKRSRRQGSDDDEPTYRSQADIECEEQIRKYNSERRSESLMEAHASKYIKSKAWQKNNDKEHDNPSARAFDREKDVLGGRKIDHRQRDELVKQSLDLGSRFARGKKSAFL